MNNISSSLPSVSLNLDMANLGAASLTEIDALQKSSESEIKKVGEDFESIFLSMMLKEMRNTISSEEGGGMFSGEGSDTYGGLFDMFMGQHLATSSQLGIGKAIESYLGNKV
jgi:flagellar protein FlgJ